MPSAPPPAARLIRAGRTRFSAVVVAAAVGAPLPRPGLGADGTARPLPFRSEEEAGVGEGTMGVLVGLDKGLEDLEPRAARTASLATGESEGPLIGPDGKAEDEPSAAGRRESVRRGRLTGDRLLPCGPDWTVREEVVWSDTGLWADRRRL